MKHLWRSRSHWTYFFLIRLGVAGTLASPLMPVALGFEDTKVLPKGVRKANIRTLSTSFSQKTNGQGKALELENPLLNPLKFNDILKSEKDLQKRELTAGFLLNESFDKAEKVGDFTADVKGKANVTVVIGAWGITENTTLALAVPYYSMEIDAKMGFVPNATGERFLQRLSDPSNNNVAGAREAGEKINNAVGRFQQKLVDNGYKPVGRWKDSGLGDTQLVAKSRLLNEDSFKLASMSAVVAPTGKKDDPNHLLDKGFGDGQWDLLAGVVTEQPVGSVVSLSQYAKYTYQMPGRKKVRAATEDEKIEVPLKSVTYKLGDKVDAGLGSSFQITSDVGMGLGYVFNHKFKDIYFAGESSSLLEKNTTEQSHHLEADVGYNTIEHFKNKSFPAPLETRLAYKYQIKSKNTAVSHFVQWDFSLFF